MYGNNKIEVDVTDHAVKSAVTAAVNQEIGRLVSSIVTETPEFQASLKHVVKTALQIALVEKKEQLIEDVADAAAVIVRSWVCNHVERGLDDD